MKCANVNAVSTVDVIQAIKGRYSARDFLEKPVSNDTLLAILDAARFSPSGVNTQPWKVIITSDNARKKLGDAIIQAKNANIPENPDYDYYPSEWVEPYKTRRKECGLALYSSLNIQIHEKEKRIAAWYRNYYFFHAPVGLIIHMDRFMSTGSWIDIGMFIQNILLSARAFGLECCPQAAMAEYPDIVRSILNIPNDQKIVCGIAIGYADLSKPVNNYRTARETVESFIRYVD